MEHEELCESFDDLDELEIDYDPKELLIENPLVGDGPWDRMSTINGSVGSEPSLEMAMEPAFGGQLDQEIPSAQYSQQEWTLEYAGSGMIFDAKRGEIVSITDGMSITKEILSGTDQEEQDRHAGLLEAFKDGAGATHAIEYVKEEEDGIVVSHMLFQLGADGTIFSEVWSKRLGKESEFEHDDDDSDPTEDPVVFIPIKPAQAVEVAKAEGIAEKPADTVQTKKRDEKEDGSERNSVEVDSDDSTQEITWKQLVVRQPHPLITQCRVAKAIKHYVEPVIVESKSVELDGQDNPDPNIPLLLRFIPPEQPPFIPACVKRERDDLRRGTEDFGRRGLMRREKQITPDSNGTEYELVSDILIDVPEADLAVEQSIATLDFQPPIIVKKALPEKHRIQERVVLRPEFINNGIVLVEKTIDHSFPHQTATRITETALTSLPSFILRATLERGREVPMSSAKEVVNLSNHGASQPRSVNIVGQIRNSKKWENLSREEVKTVTVYTCDHNSDTINIRQIDRKGMDTKREPVVEESGQRVVEMEEIDRSRRTQVDAHENVDEVHEKSSMKMETVHPHVDQIEELDLEAEELVVLNNSFPRHSELDSKSPVINATFTPEILDQVQNNNDIPELISGSLASDEVEIPESSLEQDLELPLDSQEQGQRQDTRVQDNEMHTFKPEYIWSPFTNLRETDYNARNRHEKNVKAIIDRVDPSDTSNGIIIRSFESNHDQFQRGNGFVMEEVEEASQTIPTTPLSVFERALSIQ